MLKSRIIIGVTLTLAIGAILFFWGSVRYADITDPKSYHMGHLKGLPPIGIVRWWSYITPIAIGIGGAACLRRPVRTVVLLVSTVIASAIGYSFLRLSLMDASTSRLADAQKFLWPGQSPPIDLPTLGGNIGLLGTSVFFAYFAISKLRTERRAQRDLQRFPQTEIAGSLQPIMDPYLIQPSQFPISPMLRTRIMTGLISALLIALPLYLVGAVRYQIHYSTLVERHTQGDIHFELPSAIQLLWPFGLVRWWSYLTPLAIGVGIACRLRRPVSTFPLVISLLGALMICAVAWQSFHLYAKMFSYMGYPASDPIEPEILWGNMLAITASLCFAAFSVLDRIKVGDQSPADSGN